MNYLFGEWSKALDEKQAVQILKTAKEQQFIFAKIKLEKIIQILDQVSEVWRPNSKWYNKALTILPGEIPMSEAEIVESLKIIPDLCSRKTLEKRLEADFETSAILDDFISTKRFPGFLRAVPHGVLLHVSAGNIFLGIIDSLISGLITKNVSIIRMSARNQVFPELFMQSIIEVDAESILVNSIALVHWEKENKHIENLIKKNVSAIICWGGEDMIRSYQEGLPSTVHLIKHGPKISFQFITQDGISQSSHTLDDLADQIAKDVSIWDQSACASPQNLFVEEKICVPSLMDVLEKAFLKYDHPRAALNMDDTVELLKEEYRGKMNSFTANGILKKHQNFMLHYDPRPGLRISPQHRTLILKTFKNCQDLVQQIKPYTGYLQSCGYACAPNEKSDYFNSLSIAGVKRFVEIGQQMSGTLGAPHDGSFSLSELVQFVSEEPRALSTKEIFLSKIQTMIRETPFYSQLYGDQKIQTFADLKAIKGSDLSGKWSVLQGQFLRSASGEGHVFSSGGTSGNPKYSFYSNEEFEQVAQMLAIGYQSQGLKPGDLCANLFAAGNMWSSFLAVDKALVHCRARQLGIGGTADPVYILTMLNEFKPKCVFGLPSLILELCRLSINKNIPLNIPMICYAGEHMSHQGVQYLKAHWNVQNVFSAGYASVDAGPIGYQCLHCKPGEHHLYENKVHLEIINGEGIVTSLVRENFPVIHLRTGDHIEWSGNESSCACGSRAPKFILHGRIDSQINIWSCRIQLEEVEKALEKTQCTEPIFQVRLKDVTSGSDIKGLFELYIESENANQVPLPLDFAAALKASSKDLDLTHNINYLMDKIQIYPVKPGFLERIPRTGKIKPILDLRK